MIVKRSRRRPLLPWLAMALVAAATPSARADLVFQVTVNNTAALNSTTFGAGPPYALDFTLTSGGNTNTAIISNFNLGGGSVDSSTISTTSGASGDINNPPGSVTVTDDANVNPNAGGFNDFNEVFTAGAGAVTFDVDMTTSYVSGTPDRFTFSILDSSGVPIQTTDTGNNNESALLGVNIFGPSTTISNIELYSAGSGSSAITVSVAPLGGAVPEPGTLVLTGFAIGAGVGLSLLRRRGPADADEDRRRPLPRFGAGCMEASAVPAPSHRLTSVAGRTSSAIPRQGSPRTGPMNADLIVDPYHAFHPVGHCLGDLLQVVGRDPSAQEENTGRALAIDTPQREVPGGAQPLPDPLTGARTNAGGPRRSRVSAVDVEHADSPEILNPMESRVGDGRPLRPR